MNYQWQFVANLLDRFCEDLKEQQSHFAKKVFLHQGNTSVHTYVDAMVLFIELGKQLLTHSQHFPDFAQNDQFLFRIWKKWLVRKKSDEIIVQTNAWKLEKLWAKDVELKIDCAEFF